MRPPHSILMIYAIIAELQNVRRLGLHVSDVIRDNKLSPVNENCLMLSFSRRFNSFNYILMNNFYVPITCASKEHKRKKWM